MMDASWSDREYANEVAERATERREERQAAMAELCCPECGSPSGMVAIGRECFDGMVWDWTMRYYHYAPHGDARHDLYLPCPDCNRGGRIPKGYRPVTMAWIRDWLLRPCQCPDCRRERMDNAAPADSDGRRGAERMYR